MKFTLNSGQLKDLEFLSKRSSNDVLEICKTAFDYLVNGSNTQCFEILAKKYDTNINLLQKTVEALVSLLIDTIKYNASESDIKNLHPAINCSQEIFQFVTSKRKFIESSIKSANLRSYRIVNIEWRLETRIASRALLKQSSIIVTMKLYLHTEPKNENRDLLPEGEDIIVHPEEKRNRKDIIVQTDIASLIHMIQTLEDALMESKTRRIRNLIKAIH